MAALSIVTNITNFGRAGDKYGKGIAPDIRFVLQRTKNKGSLQCMVCLFKEANHCKYNGVHPLVGIAPRLLLGACKMFLTEREVCLFRRMVF